MKNKFFKKALSVFTAMAMMLSLVTGIPFGGLGLDITARAANAQTVTIDTGEVTLSDSDGDGYYEIGTADELYAFAKLCNSVELDEDNIDDIDDLDDDLDDDDDLGDLDIVEDEELDEEN